MSGGSRAEDEPAVVAVPPSQASLASSGSSTSATSSSSQSQSQHRPVMSVRVLAETNEGNRPHMEDVTCCLFDQSRVGGQAFLAVFDGHGGRQAAAYAKEHLWENMKRQPGFDSDDHDQVKKAMREAFLVTQRGMETVVGTWPRARYGLPSTSGTTASAVLLRGRILYTAHLGDSGIVLGRKRAPVVDDGTPSDPDQDTWDSSDESDDASYEAVPLTIDHKPDCTEERQAIESRGGKVRCGTRGVYRVVWKRKRPINGRTVLNMTHSELITEEIPFLGVARSLGDLWSYNPEIGEYIVSCVPDVSHRTLSISEDHFIVLASDGLWNVLSCKQVVKSVAEHSSQMGVAPGGNDNGRDSNGNGDEAQAGNAVQRNDVDDICHRLIQEALQRWRDRRQRADNISVVVAFFNQPSNSGPASSRTPTPILNEEPAAVLPVARAEEAQQPAVEEVPMDTVPAPLQLPSLPIQRSLPADPATVVETGDVSSSEESSCDAVSPPMLRRMARVQACAQAHSIDTPSSDDLQTSPTVARTTRASVRRASSASTPPATAGSGTRASKRKSTPSSSEGLAKRASRSSHRDRTDKTPLQDDNVSSSSSGDDV